MSHADVCEQKDMKTYEITCAHNTHSQITRQELVFGLVDRQWDGSFVHCEGHNGLGCACNMKVCALDSDSMLREHNLFFNSWSSRSRSCDQPLLPCFHTPHFADEFHLKTRDFFYVMEAKCTLFNVKNEMIRKFSKKTVLLKLLYHWTKPFNDLHYFWVLVS